MFVRRLVVTVSLGFGAGVVACDATKGDATGPGPGPSATVAWSDPGSWPTGRVPAAGEDVVVPSGVAMELDVSPPALGGLRVEGSLAFADTDLELVADWIAVAGTLRIGSEDQPHGARARITLTGLPGADSIPGVGTRVIGVLPGGTLDLHGAERRPWSQLAETAAAGSNELRLAEAVDWRIGDRVVVAPSGFDPFEAEDREIVAISGRTLTLDRPLEHTHYGAVQTIAGRAVDQRAEVGLLTRSITLRGDGVSESGVVQGGTGFGGHVMILGGATARIEGVELVNMGQRGQLARYPVHWHLAGTVAGQYFRDNSVWRSNNRCVTVHGTNRLEVRDNVCYDHLGHGFFLEDGAETGNELIGNLAILARRPDVGVRLLPSDERPASFWVTNPDNRLVANRAAGSQGIGFWYALPERPTGPSAGAPDLPRRTPLLEFRGNVAHSNLRGGLFVDHGPRPDGEVETTSYQPVVDPTDVDSPPVPAVFEDLLAYKNRERGVWLRGHEHRLRGAVLADNRIAATFASSESFLEDALVAGQTANTVGQVDVYRGYEFYDGRVGARRVTFWGFDGVGTIPWSALGYNRQNAFSVSMGNVAEDLTFERSTRVFLEAPDPDMDGDKAAVFLDETGSVTGTAGAWVAADTPFLTTSQCVVRPEWNARVCPGPYVRLIMRGARAFAPVTARRDDGASEVFVGSGHQADRLSVSLLTGRSYALDLTSAAGEVELALRDARPGDAVHVHLASVSATPTIVRDYWSGDVLVPASSLSELLQSDGDRYWYDASTGRLHLRMVVRTDRDWAHLRFGS